jgi:hypothetical protein
MRLIRGDPRLEEALTIRVASDRDAAPLRRLAALDSSEPPTNPVLVVEVNRELRTALSLVDGSIVADPFHPTSDLIHLLKTRASQLKPDGSATPLLRRPGLLRRALERIHY